MLVKANQTGFYNGKRQREGDVFEVKDGTVAKWFDPLTQAPEVEAPVKKSRKKAEEPVVEKTLSEAVADGEIAASFEQQ